MTRKLKKRNGKVGYVPTKTQFYKFRTVSNFEHLADSLVNERFYCSPWSKLNDPMEGIFNLGPNVKQLIDKHSPRICSFSTNISEIMMWTHYAQNHEGVAIEFSTSKTLEIVVYPKSKPDFETIISGLDKESSIQRIMSTKLKRWKYEEEWRYITDDHKETFLEGKITKVIFGIRTSDAIKRVIKSLCKSNSIETGDTYLDATEYKIKIST